jgi:DNA-binding GntR family transcriptional regulator
MATRRVAKSAASDPAAIYARLRDGIVRGELAPGNRLVELEIAEKLGVSRTPLREALQRLQHEGYVLSTRTAHQTRLVVAPMTLADAREVFGIVGAIEGIAAQQAAALPDEPRDVLAKKLEKINLSFKRGGAARRPDHLKLVALDEQFHATIVTAGGPRLRALHAAVKPQANRYELLYVTMLENEIATSVAEHAHIVRAIAQGREREAREAALTNWRNAAARLGDAMGHVGERGSW